MNEPQWQIEKRKRIAAREAEEAKREAERKARLEELKKQAAAVFMPDVLESLGYKLKKDGKQFVVVGSTQRLFQSRTDGTWLFVDGDDYYPPLSFMMNFEGYRCMAALEYLTGGSLPQKPFKTITEKTVDEPPQTLKLPYTNDSYRMKCVDYLVNERGVSNDVISIAAKRKMITFTKMGPAFLGFDPENQLRFVETRFFSPQPNPNKPDKPLTKKSHWGTDKTFAPLFHGDPDVVHVVEGGLDGLAALDISRKKKLALPSVIVTGGSRSCKFLNNPNAIALLKNARAIFVWGEHEKDAETQQENDASHFLQVQSINELLGKNIAKYVMPPEKAKDLAVLNQLM